MKTCISIFVLTSLLVLRPVPGLAASSELQALLDELKIAAAGTVTIQSGFEQEKNLAMFAETLKSQGKFVYQKPNRLRWELLSPVASGFVLSEGKGERWNSLSRERGRFSVDNDPIMGMIARQLLAWAQVDVDWLQSRYQMELKSSQPVRLRLTPLDSGEAGFIEYLQILFAEDKRHIAEVLMMEQGGDSTLLRFTDVQLNTELPEEAFQPPEF